MKNGEKSSNIVNNIWQFFASIQMTVAVLLSLAATSAIGTFIPQNASHEAYIHTYGEVWYRILYAFDIFDMYHSWWFRFLILMLTANIIVCSIERLSSLWKIIFVKKPAFRISTFRNLSRKEEFYVDRPLERLKKEYESFMADKFGYSRTEETESGFCIFAEKGRWTRLGVYIVHLSVVFLLLGSLIGSIFGFEGFVNIPEGGSVSEIRLRNSNETKPLDFEIRCEDFNVSFYESGAPKEYRSSLVLHKNGQTLLEKDIIVNDPIRYSGINIFQSSYGNVPPDINSMKKDGVALSFTSKDTNMVYEKKVYPGKPIALPEGLGTFVIKDFIHSYKFMGQRDLGDAFVGTLTPENGEAAEVYLPLRFPRFDKMRKGGRFIIAVKGYKQAYYTGLQVTSDPGVMMVYAGFLLMIAGCFITFFMSHERVCVEVTPNDNKIKVFVSGTANKNKVGMENIVRDIARRLSGRE